MKEGQILLVECKAGLNPYLSSKQLNNILEISKNSNATSILAVRKKHREIRWFKINDQNMKEVKLKEVPLFN